MTEYRREHDSLGELEVESDKLYGGNTKRAMENFSITGQKMDGKFKIALAEVKKACAIENERLGLLENKKAYAIEVACDDVISGKYADQFVTDAIQGGAGTSFNMNMNEVLANLANMSLGGRPGVYDLVHPNDHVNMCQSTNDVIPTAGKIAAIRYFKELKEENERLLESLSKKSEEFDEVYKMGRTQLEDAVPIRLGQEFAAYRRALARDGKRFDLAIEALSTVNLGGTAIGTGINADDEYVKEIVGVLNEVTGLKLTQAEDLIDGTQNLDPFSYASSILKVYAINLSKISNDLRLMNSGPQAGLGDIALPSKQAGSSIMPGKVNPVIPEVVNQVAFRVLGNDTTINFAVEGGQLELNAFEPVIFYSLFESLKILKGAIYTLRVNCLDGMAARAKEDLLDVEKNVGLVTALTPLIGYEKSSDLAHQAQKTGQTVRNLALDQGLLSPEELDYALDFKKMTSPGRREE